MDIKEIDKKTASSIIENRILLGLFWVKEDEVYVGMDNTTGDAWGEEFKDLESCYKYLNKEN